MHTKPLALGTEAEEKPSQLSIFNSNLNSPKRLSKPKEPRFPTYNAPSRQVRMKNPLSQRESDLKDLLTFGNSLARAAPVSHKLPQIVPEGKHSKDRVLNRKTIGTGLNMQRGKGMHFFEQQVTPPGTREGSPARHGIEESLNRIVRPNHTSTDFSY